MASRSQSSCLSHPTVGLRKAKERSRAMLAGSALRLDFRLTFGISATVSVAQRMLTVLPEQWCSPRELGALGSSSCSAEKSVGSACGAGRKALTFHPNTDGRRRISIEDPEESDSASLSGLRFGNLAAIQPGCPVQPVGSSSDLEPAS